MADNENVVFITDQRLDVRRVRHIIPNKDGTGRTLSLTIVKDSPQDDTVRGRKLDADQAGVGAHHEGKEGASPGFMGNRDDYTLEQLTSSGFVRVWQRLHPEDNTFPKAESQPAT